MSRAPSDLLALLRQLPKRPTDEQLAPCVRAIIEYSNASRQPAMSAAALLRSQAKPLGLSKPAIERLRVVIGDHFRTARRRQAREERANREYVSQSVAARLLGEDQADLLAKLIDPVQRRLYGWPYWSGATFMLPLLACRAATRAAFLATLPEIEPAAIAQTLPPWCRREMPGDRRLTVETP